MTSPAAEGSFHAASAATWPQPRARAGRVSPETVRRSRDAALLACVTGLTTFFILAVTTRVDQFAFVWPVSGAAMALILPRWTSGPRVRALLLAGAAFGVVAGGTAAGMPGWLAAQTAGLTVLDVVLTSFFLLPAISTFADLKHRATVVRFALTVILVPLCTSVTGASTLAGLLHHTFLRTAIQAFFANSLGMALTFPAALLLLTGERSTLRCLWQRSALLSILLFTAATGIVFWQNSAPALFLVFPPMIVVLMVLGLEGAVVVTLLLTAIGWLATMHGHGPILLMRDATPDHRLFILQIFQWTCLATAMPVGALLDERRSVQRKAEEARGIYETMLNNADEMIVLSSIDGEQRHVSPAVERITGWSAEEYLAMDRLATLHPADQDMAANTLQSLSAGKWEHSLHYRILQKRGEYCWVEANLRAYGDKTAGVVKGYVAAIRDISAERQWAEERAALTREQSRLVNLASTDALTGLPNRRALEELLCAHEFDMQRQAEHAAAVSGDYRVSLRKLTIMMVDVDYFKLYNDTYGHAAGDSCLRQLAGILRSNLARKDDVVARLGGEEFAIVLPGAGHTAAMCVAERLLAAVREANQSHSASPLRHVTVSIGVAVASPDKDFRYAHLLQQADRALYKSKASGKNCASLSRLPS